MILVGEGEWDGLLEWLRVRALGRGRIAREDLASMHVAREPADVVEIVSAAVRRRQASEP